jgi:hypothetical protein
MPTRNVNLTDQQDASIEEMIRSGNISGPRGRRYLRACWMRVFSAVSPTAPATTCSPMT